MPVLRPIKDVDMPVFLSRFDTYVTEIAPGLEMPPFSEWWNVECHRPYWLEVDGRRIGFALTRFLRENQTDLSEFCIYPEYRRSGYGCDAARQILRSGGRYWSIGVVHGARALGFWRNVVTHPDFTVVEHAPMNEYQQLTYVVTVNGVPDV